MVVQPLPLARYSVLIVDDDPEARRHLHRLLAANGYAVVEAGNGRIARSLLAEREIDLVVSDIFMPECDGFELIAAIRAMERAVPVIAMSDHESWTGLNFLNAANDLGAAAVIEKPFRGEVLLHLINGALIAVQRDARVVKIGAFGKPARRGAPCGLEWVAARPAKSTV